MSRLDELKKQYPELNISLFDLLNRMDTSKTYKYMPLLCKIFGERFDAEKQYGFNKKSKIDGPKDELVSGLTHKGITCSDLTFSELYTIHQFTDFYNYETFTTVKEFMERMDKNQMENKDVTSYPNLESLRTAVSLASIKELTKELEGQVIKEYEDDRWLVVRPLTFQASAKYGASTRWCTTYQKEKQYFEKYWQYGILVYFINKVTGYKFAGYKSLKDGDELSFWNAEDNRVDYLNVDADDYLFPIVRRILGSNKTNKELCSTEIQNQVMNECGYNVRKMSLLENEPAHQEMMVEEIGEMEVREPRYVVETLRDAGEQIREYVDNDIVSQLREIAREHYPEDSISEAMPMRT